MVLSLKANSFCAACFCLNAVTKKGSCQDLRIRSDGTKLHGVNVLRTCPKLEIAGNANPKMPSAGSPTNSGDSDVIAEKYCCVALTPPTVTEETSVSCGCIFDNPHPHTCVRIDRA